MTSIAFGKYKAAINKYGIWKRVGIIMNSSGGKERDE